METNNRNFFITIILSVLILTLWQVFYMNPRIEAERKAAELEAARVQEKGAATQPGLISPGPAATQNGTTMMPAQTPQSSSAQPSAR